MAGLRRAERGLDRLLVAHLADEDDVRVLAQDAPQRARIVAAADAVPDEDLPVFTGPVTTRLPYRCSTRTDVKDLDRYSGFMIDEDRLIGLRVSADFGVTG